MRLPGQTMGFWPFAVILFAFPQEISTLATELQDMGATTRTGLYIGAGVSAGLALILISGGLILKCKSFDGASLSL